MDREQIKSTFDQQSATYDQQWTKLAAFREAPLILVGSIFAKLPRDARVLCVGVGTGAEMQSLAERFPGWTFTAVEPSSGMLDACRQRAEAHGFAHRCTFHEGYLDSLQAGEPFDAATSFLVSQFLLDASERTAYERDVAVLPPARVASILRDGSFVDPVQFFQAGLIHGWYATRP